MTDHPPRFLSQLKPVDFSATAELGCFVYCYLRADGSPYYVGVATRGDRPLDVRGRNAPPPRDLVKIRVLRSGLSREQAIFWERFYIAHYGRKDIGTGILRNLTAGGDGITEASAKTKEKISAANLRRAKENPESFLKSEQWRRSVRRANTSSDVAVRYGFSFEEWLSLPKAEKTNIRTRHYAAQRRAQRLGDAAAELRGRAARTAYTDAVMAERHEISAEQWAALDRSAKSRVHARYRLGHRGAALFADKLPQPPKPCRSARYAERYGIAPDLWRSLSSARKGLVRDRFTRGITDLSELLDFSDRRLRTRK